MTRILTSAAPAALVAGSLMHASPAFAETEFSTDVSLGVSASTNPYLQTGPVNSSLSGSVTVTPRLTVTENVTSFTLSGFGHIEEYEENFQTNNSFGLSGGVDHSLSERTELRGRIGFDGSIIGVNTNFFNPPNVFDDNFLPPIADDIALNGTNQRRNSFQGGIGLSHSISELDSISLDVSATAIRFGDMVVQDQYNFFGQNVAYSRILSESTTIGASLGLSQVNYLGQSQGDSNVITPSLTFDQQLGPDFSVSGSLGASFTRVDNGLGKTSSTDFSGSLSLCRQAETSNFCLNASRQTLPSSFDGVRSQTTFGMGYSKTLTRNDDVSINVGYTRSSNPILGPIQVTNSSLEYVSATATLNHRFQDRISGFVSAGYNDSFQSGFSRRANKQVSIGIRISFGNDR